MYGKVTEYPQNELTKFNPVSPYGEAKVYAHKICKKYRETYGMQVSCGILFNHESPLRGEEFVTRKITSSLAKIKHGLLDILELGNLDAQRDWGHAKDYVEGMWAMLQQPSPETFILATGRTETVRRFLTLSAEHAGFSLAFEGQGEQEIAVVDAAALDHAKSLQRNLLALSDWTEMPSVQSKHTAEWIAAWAEYRTLVRDVDKQEHWPLAINWPKEPLIPN
jgi:GDPmannose 4,6-dehydratase